MFCLGSRHNPTNDQRRRGPMRLSLIHDETSMTPMRASLSLSISLSVSLSVLPFRSVLKDLFLDMEEASVDALQTIKEDLCEIDRPIS
jgi:hypothetical protein